MNVPLSHRDSLTDSYLNSTFGAIRSPFACPFGSDPPGGAAPGGDARFFLNVVLCGARDAASVSPTTPREPSVHGSESLYFVLFYFFAPSQGLFLFLFSINLM